MPFEGKLDSSDATATSRPKQFEAQMTQLKEMGFGDAVASEAALFKVFLLLILHFLTLTSSIPHAVVRGGTINITSSLIDWRSGEWKIECSC
jgi:hypothetical protein